MIEIFYIMIERRRRGRNFDFNAWNNERFVTINHTLRTARKKKRKNETNQFDVLLPVPFRFTSRIPPNENISSSIVSCAVLRFAPPGNKTWRREKERKIYTYIIHISIKIAIYYLSYWPIFAHRRPKSLPSQMSLLQLIRDKTYIITICHFQDTRHFKYNLTDQVTQVD